MSPDVPGHHARAIDLIRKVCGLAGSLTFLDDVDADLRREGIRDAVARRNTPKLFDWLLTSFSFQGISDQVARSYMRQHGTASWSEIAKSLQGQAPCPLLQSHWHFDGCRYEKVGFTCSEPDHIGSCPLPRHKLRNGRLNQTAYSFYLFVRDVAKNDLVGWIDDQLISPKGPTASGSVPSLADQAADRQERLIGPLRNIYGVSDKILTMTLSGLLMGASKGRPHWFETGKAMIAIDTLIHNFLHRTGILEDGGVVHSYGVGCYAKGCADVVRAAASQIDARAFNRSYPKVFPRFVQHAIWRFCAADGSNICNGNRIDDREACQNNHCQLFSKCRRKALKIQ